MSHVSPTLQLREAEDWAANGTRTENRMLQVDLDYHVHLYFG